MRSQRAYRVEFIIDPDRDQWLIDLLEQSNNKSRTCRDALANYYDPPAPPPDPQIDELAQELTRRDQEINDLWARVGELERQIAYLQGRVTTYENAEPGGLFARLRNRDQRD